VIIDYETVPAGSAGSFTFTGVPTGTISGGGTLVVSDLEPGTYTTTEVDPAPEFDVTAVECDDGESATPSSGDGSSRTAVVNLDPGETVRCTFTNTRRGALVVAGRTVPEGTAGTFQFTGVPSGTIPSGGTLVVANLEPGTYTSTQVDPAPEFDLTAIECDDGGSATVSSGDPGSRSVNYQLDPGEMVTCTFVNTRRGTLVVAVETDPEDAAGTFQFTGVPSGTVSAGGTLVVANLTPGTYTSTEVDPEPDFELTAVECDDGESSTASSGDATTRSAVFNLDGGETVSCTFVHSRAEDADPSAGTGTPGEGAPGEGEEGPGTGLNPFEDPDDSLEPFPLPDDLPPDAGTFAAPKPGPWSATNFAGQMDCGVTALPIPASPAETGSLEVLDGGQTVIASGLEDSAGVAITLSADPEINGRYSGSFEATEQGVPIVIDYYWQVVTDEYIVGYLTSAFSSEGVSCTIYRPFELVYVGQ
jgi:hypothetical protein